MNEPGAKPAVIPERMERIAQIFTAWSEYKQGIHAKGIGGMDQSFWLVNQILAAEAKVAEQTAKIVELEAFKKSVLNSCIGCGYSLFLPQEPRP